MKNKYVKASLLFLFLILLYLSFAYFYFYKAKKEVLLQSEPLMTTENNTTKEPTIVYDDGIFEKTRPGEAKNTSWEFYRIKNNAAYYRDKVMPRVDISTFQEIGNNWAKDKNHVYWEDQEQAYLDPVTVKVFPHFYVIDRSGVWLYGTGFHMKVIKMDADQATFSVISDGYGKDKNHIYYSDKIIVDADSESFVLLNKSTYPLEGISSWYAKDVNDAYYRSSAISGADIKSFIFVGGDYAKDKYNVYYQGKVLLNADPKTFEIVGNYTKDKNHVFNGSEVLSVEISPSSFSVVTDSVIKDNKHVYFYDYLKKEYNLLSNVDAPSFKLIGSCGSVEMSGAGYFKDNNNIFIGTKPIDLIDVSSFEYFGNYSVAYGMPYSVSYAKDKNNVYYSCGEILKNADLDTFKDLKDGYAKDKNNVWYLAKIVKQDNLTTFKSLGNGYAKNKSHIYFAGVVINVVDIATFEILKSKYGGSYSRDKNNVYNGGEIVQGINPKDCTNGSLAECIIM